MQDYLLDDAYNLGCDVGRTYVNNLIVQVDKEVCRELYNSDKSTWVNDYGPTYHSLSGQYGYTEYSLRQALDLNSIDDPETLEMIFQSFSDGFEDSWIITMLEFIRE